METETEIGSSGKQLLFAKGSKVEVSSDEDGFRGSWYVAAVVDHGPSSTPNPRKRKQSGGDHDRPYLVEYETLEADGGRPLSEWVSASVVRPSQPLPSSDEKPRFEINDVVDGFYCDGWWTGVVTRVDKDSNVVVLFPGPSSAHEIKFAPANLRVHLDWVNGNWIRPQQQQEIIQPKGGASSQKRKRGRPPKVRVERPIGLVEDSQDTHTEETYEVLKDQPQLMLHKRMDAPSTMDDSKNSISKTVMQCAVASDGKDGNAIQSPAIASTDNGNAMLSSATASTDNDVSQKNRNLPFVKHSLIWETLESMEIFQKMPQQPHFRPLEEYKEDIREGLAIGYMVTFTNVVERISQLQFSSPTNTIISTLETISDLKNNGFDVDFISGRLKELLSKKEMEGPLLEELKGVEMQIMERSLENNKIDEEIHEIHSKMEELEEKLALASSRAKTKHCEVDALKSKIEIIVRDIQNAKHDFERLLTAPWASGRRRRQQKRENDQ
ncbi:DUF724 domain-containing protein [Actinidia chinensis var. chinensis]|uniref:DUF724 domain-containing protein n=1 Tax=Actinidia chinensis var. chinensis TaxID=1590841 RepID=A0A2R6PYB1_ACTCC|nr:DUF724 domain-containing protein [Actinidia chinensis var. chinensis]